MKQIIAKIRQAQQSNDRRKKFEKMHEQLDPPKPRRPAAKSVAKQ
jgi:hypothetical protein